SRVIDENVQTAAFVADLHYHGFNLRGISNVAFDDKRIGQGLRDVLSIGFVLPLRIGNVIDHAFRAALSKSLDRFGPDATGTAGDEHDFAGEIEWIRHLMI